MADAVSIPCQFDEAWRGACKQPSTNGWCSRHENLKCASCGERGVRSCSETMGALCCGAPLCATCGHLSDGRHASQDVVADELRKKQEEWDALKLSRTSPVQRVNEQGVPLNLFELKKGDPATYTLCEFYYLELEHGLMGFFPAVVEKEVVMTTDRELLGRLWKTLDPRQSKMSSNVGFIHVASGVVYPRLGDDQYFLEQSKPHRLFTAFDFEDPAVKIDWAFGLIGGPDITVDGFHRMIDREMQKVGA